MNEYVVRLSIPSNKNRWQAELVERHIEAENLNYLIMKAATVQEYKAGARIISIQEHRKSSEGYLYWERIK